MKLVKLAKIAKVVRKKLVKNSQKSRNLRCLRFAKVLLKVFIVREIEIEASSFFQF